MIELSKCPNCAETDKVTIAGKVFCVKCGTPTEEANQPVADAAQPTAEPTSQSANPVVSEASAGFPSVQKFQAAPSAPAPAVDPPQPEPNQVPVTTPPQLPTAPAPEPPPPVAEPEQPTPMPAPTPEQPQDTQKLDDHINTLSQPVQAPAAPEPQENPTPAVEPVAPLAGIAPVATEAPIASPPPVTTAPTAISNPSTSMADIKPVSRVSEHVGSEIMSLDKKDNAVFSDDQLNELAKIASEPPKPNSITVPQSNDTTPAPSEAPEPEVAAAPIAKSPVASTTTQDIKPPGKPAAEPKPDMAQVVENSADQTKEEPKSNFSEKTKKGLKPASIALTIVALFLVGAYVWQVNYPSLAFKIASAKAGISASLPGYIPSGWKMLGDISTNPGTVSYALASPDNNKKIAITQTKTDWDSQALAENYVAPKAENYLALQAQGLTIYVYGHNQASWVNKGTWYKIETTDQSLSQDQIIKIATSL